MLIPDDLDMELDEFVERFEIAYADRPGIDIAEFMPSPQHPRYAHIACELLRVHMELSASSGSFLSAEEYRQRFPAVFEQSVYFKDLQAEEERVKASSRAVALSSTNRSQHSSSPASSSRANAIGEKVEVPKLGQNVCGFQLIAELGRGAFSQVYLAQDDSLSQRRVVLKISSKLLGEADLLSRLQHKNIVPVYSLHKYGQYHLICMPFLGTMTLADMLSAQPKGPSALSGKAMISTLAAQASRTWKEDSSTAPSGVKAVDNAADNASGNVTSDATSHEETRLTADEPTLDRGLSSQLAAEVSRMTTTELALWIISELADGLAHAHQRGVLHRDIKPANVLLSDDGLPMLLDFNLAASTKPDDRSQDVVGGTLRYMSPEQLRAVQNQRSSLDARADIFSLGVVLYELLHRRAPFLDRTGSWNSVLEQMLSDRQQPPRLSVDWREGLTPAVVSILQRALAFDPNERYQSASEFRDDLRAHLQARPLPTANDRSLRERVRKWNVRHPRLSSMTLAAAMTGIMLCGTIAWTLHRQSQINRLRAGQWLSELEHASSDARTLLASDQAPTRAVEDWLQQSSTVLATNANQQLNRLTGHDRARAQKSLGRLHFYRARGALGLLERQPDTQYDQWISFAAKELTLSQTYEPTELASAWQDKLGQMKLSDAGLGTAGEASPKLQPTRDARLVSATEPDKPEPDKPLGDKPTTNHALRFELDSGTLQRELEDAISTAHAEASNPWYWVAVGQMQLSLGKLEPAASSFMLGHSLAQREPLPSFFLGLVDMKRKNFAAAEDWFTFTLAEDPNCLEARFNRAAARVELAKLPEAVEDILALGDQISRFPRAWFIRELAETRMGRSDDAKRSRQRGIQLTPTDALGWNARGQARLRQPPVDAAAALTDFETAIRLDPQLRNAYENSAHVLSERLSQPQAAIDRLSQVLKIDPSYALAWSSRAVLLARQGDHAAAISDVEQALKLERAPMICYQCASAIAIGEAAEVRASNKDATTDKDTQLTSLQLLKETLRKDASLSRFMRKDQDLRTLLNNPEFQELLNAAARLQ